MPAHSRQGDHKKKFYASAKISRELWSCKQMYIIRDHAGYYKIGISCDPHKRMAQMQTEHALPLEMIYATGGVSAHMRGLEKEYHEILASHGLRMNGEWFDLSDEMLDNVLEWIAEDWEQICINAPSWYTSESKKTVYIEYKRTMSRYAA